MAGPTVAIREQCPLATPINDGLMSAQDNAKLASLSPGGGATLTQVYDLGAVSADQTANIDPAKGGGIVVKAAVVAVGSLLRALSSVSSVIFDVVDAVIPKVLAAGTFIQNDPGFGSPVMGSQTLHGFMSYTADGNGPNWGGTGMTAMDSGLDSVIRLTINDVPVTEIFAGHSISSGYGCDPAVTLPIVANAIAPVKFLNIVGAGLIKNITVPPVGATASVMIAILPSAAFTWDTTGNIPVAGTAVQNQLLFFILNGGNWFPSYT
jgi:hypothetical protein